jgi:hypothetical protein
MVIPRYLSSGRRDRQPTLQGERNPCATMAGGLDRDGAVATMVGLAQPTRPAGESTSIPGALMNCHPPSQERRMIYTASKLQHVPIPANDTRIER